MKKEKENETSSTQQANLCLCLEKETASPMDNKSAQITLHKHRKCHYKVFYN